MRYIVLFGMCTIYPLAKFASNAVLHLLTLTYHFYIGLSTTTGEEVYISVNHFPSNMLSEVNLNSGNINLIGGVMTSSGLAVGIATTWSAASATVVYVPVYAV